MKSRNIIAACVLLAVAAGYGYLTAGLPVRTLPNTPDPSFFPWINTGLLVGLSAALLIQGLWFTADDESVARRGAFPASVVAALAFFLAYLVALPWIGFVEASVPFFLAFMVLFGERRAPWLLAGGVGVPVALFVLFRQGFGVLLPGGILTELLR